MSVVDNKPDTGTPPPALDGKGKGGPSAWIKKNKLAAGGIAGGALLLLMSHKGKSKGKTGEVTAEEQQAMDNARIARAQAASVLPAGAPISTGGNEGGAVTPANPSGAAAIPTPGQQENPAVAGALEAVGAGLTALAASNASREASREGTTATPAPQQSAVAKKPAPKKPAKAKPQHTAQHGGVTVHGRHFPGATGSHKGPVHTGTNGHTKQTVTIHHPGKTNTHISHNGGKQWTDHVPGHTPPKRSVPTHTAPHPAQHAPVAAHRAPARPAPRKPAKPAPRKRR